MTNSFSVNGIQQNFTRGPLLPNNKSQSSVSFAHEPPSLVTCLQKIQYPIKIPDSIKHKIIAVVNAIFFSLLRAFSSPLPVIVRTQFILFGQLVSRVTGQVVEEKKSAIEQYIKNDEIRDDLRQEQLRVKCSDVYHQTIKARVSRQMFRFVKFLATLLHKISASSSTKPIELTAAKTMSVAQSIFKSLGIGSKRSGRYLEFKNARETQWINDIKDQLQESDYNEVKDLFESVEPPNTVQKFLNKFRRAWTHGSPGPRQSALQKLALYMRVSHPKFNTTFRTQLNIVKQLANGNTFMEIEGQVAAPPLWLVRSQKLAGHINSDFDPSIYNLPHDIATITRIEGEKIRHIKAIRMSSPTIESEELGSRGQAEITPEWEAFIKEYQQLGKVHLDVINQRRTDSEQPRTEARIQAAALSKDSTNNHKQALFAIVLPVDGDLYNQTGKFGEAQMPKEKFLNELCNTMLTSNEYYIPSEILVGVKATNSSLSLVNDQLKKLATDLLNHLNPEQGGNLSREERQNFMHLFYAKIVNHAMDAVKADSFNCTCKDGIDRGAAVMRSVLEISGAEAGDTLEATYVSGAYQTKGQVPIQERHDRYVAAAKIFEEKKSDLIIPGSKVQLTMESTAASPFNHNL